MAYWMLQCTPRKYRIFDYWRDHPNEPDTWMVSLFSDKIEVGDIVFIWLSNDRSHHVERGIYARAKVVLPPDFYREPYISGKIYQMYNWVPRRCDKFCIVIRVG